METNLNLNVLIVEDSRSIFLLYQTYLKNDNYKLTHVEYVRDAKKMLEETHYDIILLDLHLPDVPGLELLKYMNEHNIKIPTIVVTVDNRLDTVVEAMKLNAFDFMEKPFSKERILVSMRNAIKDKELNNKINMLSTLNPTKCHMLLGESASMQAVYKIIENVSQSDATVFITGESGTGKELCAHALHNLGNRSTKPFISLNCASISKNLIESEIFGHMKGSFTNAYANRLGAAREANGGVLFLDEICEMDFELQAKFLRFIQTKTVTPIGSTDSYKVDIRFICATNKDPMEEVIAGNFREDLFYRLFVVPIQMPPLRIRSTDICVLARNFLKRYTKEENKSFKDFDEDAINFFMKYRWPGNVRQIENIIQSVVVMNDGEYITMDMLPPTILNDNIMVDDYDVVHAQHVSSSQSANDDSITPLWLMEKNYVESVIKQCNGNIVKAAGYLEISPSTIYRKISTWNKGDEFPQLHANQ